MCDRKIYIQQENKMKKIILLLILPILSLSTFAEFEVSCDFGCLKGSEWVYEAERLMLEKEIYNGIPQSFYQ